MEMYKRCIDASQRALMIHLSLQYIQWITSKTLLTR